MAKFNATGYNPEVIQKSYEAQFDRTELSKAIEDAVKSMTPSLASHYAKAFSKNLDKNFANDEFESHGKFPGAMDHLEEVGFFDESTKKVAKKCVNIIFHAITSIDSDYMDGGEFVSRMANKLVKLTPSKYLYEADNAQSVKMFAAYLLQAAGDLNLIEIVHHEPFIDEEDLGSIEENMEGEIDYGTTRIIGKLSSVSAKLFSKLKAAAKTMRPSVTPYKKLKSNSGQLYKYTKGISYNVFGKSHIQDNDVVAPLDFVNTQNRMPLYFDIDFLESHKGITDIQAPFDIEEGSDEDRYHDNFRVKVLDFMTVVGDNPFYVKHTLDSKNRIYCTGFVNYQKGDLSKVMIDLGEYVINSKAEYKTALRGCEIHIANCLDFDVNVLGVDLESEGYNPKKALDKHTFEQRIAIVKKLHAEGKLVKEEAFNKFYAQAKSKGDKRAPVLQLLKAIKEYDKLQAYKLDSNKIKPKLDKELVQLAKVLGNVDIKVFEAYLRNKRKCTVDLSTEFLTEGTRTLLDSNKGNINSVTEDLNRFRGLTLEDDTDVLEALCFYVKRKKLFSKKSRLALVKSYAAYLFMVNLDSDYMPIDLRGMVALDATCSFAQVGAILSGNITDALFSNIIGDGREDLYQVVYDELDGLSDEEFSLGKTILTRTQVKDAVMQTVYGSGSAWRIFEVEDEDQTEANKKSFMAVLHKVMPGTMRVIEFIREHLLDDEAYGHTWYNGDEYNGEFIASRVVHSTYSNNKACSKQKLRDVVTIDYVDKEDEDYGNVQSEFDLEVVSNQYLKGEENIGLIALLIQSFDAYIARVLTRKCKEDGFNIFGIHDSFACQYKYYDKMSQHYQDIIFDLVTVGIGEGKFDSVFGDIVNDINEDVDFAVDEHLRDYVSENDINQHCLC